MNDDVFSVGESTELIRKGQEAVKNGNLEAAVTFLAKAIKSDPSQKKRVEPYLNKVRNRLVRQYIQTAEGLENEGEDEEAIEIYRKAIRFEPDDPELVDEIRDRIESYESIRETTRYGIFYLLCAIYVAAAAAAAFWIYLILD